MTLFLGSYLSHWLRRQHDPGMEERPGDPGCDGDQFPLPGEHLHLPGLGKLGQIYGSSVANQRRDLFSGRNAWKLGQQLAWVNEQFFMLRGPTGFVYLFQSVGLVQIELAQHSAAQ